MTNAAEVNAETVARCVREHVIAALERHGDYPAGSIVVSRTDGSGGQWYSPGSLPALGPDDARIPLAGLTLYRARRMPLARILSLLSDSDD